MLWRAPWLRHRLALMGIAAWDAVSLFTSYNLLYVTRIGRWEGLTPGLAVVSVTWLGVSYLIGRYSPPTSSQKLEAGVQISKTILTGLAVIAVFISHSWVYQVVDAQTRFRGFLIPLIILACCLSMLGTRLLSRVPSKETGWLVIGNKLERETVAREIACERYDVRRKPSILTSGNISEANERGWIGTNGIVVGTIADNAESDIEELLRLRETGENVVPLLSWCEQELQRIPPELVRTEWLIQAEGFGLRPGSTSWRIKRLGDVLGSIALIAATTPLLLTAGLLVWIEDRGPVLYSQIRSGLYGRPIRIWKLRSMRVDAEKEGAQWASKGDPRVTKVGRIIRATRIDELPQLFNVLSGSLSLIGPRPERPEIEENLQYEIPNYRIRHWIRPGLSGWAQVCYPYGASIEDSRMKLSHDIYYLRNASLALDILILMKTVRTVLNASGATPKQ